ncbi:hypothetical protein [Paenibacillus sp. FSL M7-0420]|uniref:hypothetical protein n=1 Tax=Paenibacillus sp. FSL M7-0420 TaxID=2921609 RepID=UPI0030FC6238
MPCSKNNLIPVSMPMTPTISTHDGFSSISGRRLYICDNPEPLNASVFAGGPMATMWSELVPNTTSVSYRLFVWHHNPSSDTTRKYGVTIGNAGASAVTVGGIRYDSVVGTNSNFLNVVGTCLAETLLAQSYSSAPNITIGLNKVQTILEFELKPNEVRGLLVEFTLTSPTPITARIRTVAGSTASQVLNTWQGSVIGTVGGHPRGSWNYSEVQGSGRTISFGAAASMNGISVLGAASPVFPEPSPSGGMLANPAGFGGIYNINLTLQNTSGKQQTADLYLNPRGGAFVGAVKVGSNPVAGIPVTQAAVQGVKIGGFSINAGQSVTVPVRITSGGGASTPVALVLHNRG